MFGEVFTGSITLARLHLSRDLFSQEAVVASAGTTTFGCPSQLLIDRIPNSLYWHAYCVPVGFGKNCIFFLACDGCFDVASTIGFHDIQSWFYQNMCLNLYRRPSGFWYVQGWLRWLHSPTASHADSGSPNWMGWLQRLGVWFNIYYIVYNI